MMRTDTFAEFTLTGKTYSVLLKIEEKTSAQDAMTVLLYTKEHIEKKVDSPIEWLYDKENLTNEEEILQEKLMRVFYRLKGDPGSAPGEEEEEKETEMETIYLNGKGQLIQIAQVEKNERIVDLHQIISFDVKSLPQSKHEFGKNEPSKQPLLVPRAKVPVKDGRSQMDFIKKSAAKSHMVENPHNVYYTMEEVAKHKKADDVWTVHLGMVYDITEYAKVHPGGKKIMLGAGKDCTELFNKYHPWVNCGFLIGKYHIGMLKRE